jgi:hypothetical protein
MSLCFFTIAPINTLDLPAGVLVAKTNSGYVRVLSRKVGTRKIKESIIRADFAALCDKGIICHSAEIPENMKANYEGLVG